MGAKGRCHYSTRGGLIKKLQPHNNVDKAVQTNPKQSKEREKMTTNSPKTQKMLIGYLNGQQNNYTKPRRFSLPTNYPMAECKRLNEKFPQMEFVIEIFRGNEFPEFVNEYQLYPTE